MGKIHLDEMKSWAESIPMDELFSEIKKVTGLDDLVFNYRIEENRNGSGIIIRFTSQDLAERSGFLHLMFKELYITQFNSSVSEEYDKDTYEYLHKFSYWGSVDFSYSHPGGGSNGCAFLNFWYDDKQGWQFRLEGE
jgi:hypothetical protein